VLSEEEDAEEESGGSGGRVKLKVWNQRKGRNLGYESAGGRAAPLIELAPHPSEERSLLESISNHVVARGVAPQEELKL
jgi:hypothetical protein